VVKIFAYNKWGAGDYLSHLKGVLDAYEGKEAANSANQIDTIFVSRSLAACELAKYYGKNVLQLNLKNLIEITWAFLMADVIIFSIGAKKEYYLGKTISMISRKKILYLGDRCFAERYANIAYRSVARQEKLENLNSYRYAEEIGKRHQKVGILDSYDPRHKYKRLNDRSLLSIRNCIALMGYQPILINYVHRTGLKGISQVQATNWSELRECLRNIDFYVSGDSGWGHFAHEIGISGLSVFTAGDLVSCKPASQTSSSLGMYFSTSQPHCAPCMIPGGKFGCREILCQGNLNKGAMLTALLALKTEG